MAKPIPVPDIGTTVDQVRLIRWLKNEGDTVKRGDALCEVETDRATSEPESIADGVPEGEASGVDAPALDEGHGAPNIQRPAPGVAVPPLIKNLAKREGIDLARVTGTTEGGRNESQLRCIFSAGSRRSHESVSPFPWSTGIGQSH